MIIELTRGVRTLISEVDAALREVPWYAHKGRRGRLSAARRIRTPRGKRTVFLHRVIAGAQDPETGEQLTDLVVDHINRDPLDNRRENLRLVTQRKNSWNRSGDSVYWNRKIEKWQAVVAVACDSREAAVRAAEAMKEAGRVNVGD